MAFPGELTVFDNANRANGDAYVGGGSTIWQNMDLGGAGGSLVVNTNKLAWDGTGDGNGTLTVNTDANFIRIFEITTIGGYLAYFFRLQSETTGSWQGYWMIIDGSNWKIRKRVSGVSSDVASVTESSIAGDGDLVGLRVYGDLIEVYHYQGTWEAPVISVNDSTFAAGGPQALALGNTNLRLNNIDQADPALSAPAGAVTIYVNPDHGSSSDAYNRTTASNPATPLKTMQRAAMLAYATNTWADTINVAIATVADATNIDPRMYAGIDHDLFSPPLPFGDNSGNEPITVQGAVSGDSTPLIRGVNGHNLKNWIFQDLQQGYDPEDVASNNLGTLQRPEDLTFRRIHYTSGGYNVDYYSGEILWDDCEVNAPLTTYGNLDGRGFGIAYAPTDGLPGEHAGHAHFDGCRFIGIRGNDAIQCFLGGVTAEWIDAKLTVENSLFHDVTEGDELYHTDSIQCLGGYEFVIRNNAFIGCANALMASDYHNRKIVFEGNLVVGAGGLVQVQGTDNFIMRHNTLISYGYADSAILFYTRFVGSTNKVTIVNNIFGGINYRDSTAALHDPASVISNNIVLTNPGWNSGFGTNLAGLPEFGYSARMADLPTERLVDPPPPWASTPFDIPANYELANSPITSPGIGQGMVTDIATDRLGRAYANPPDVGCHQSSATVVTAVARAPYITGRSPTPNATGVARNTNIVLTLFPKPGGSIDAGTVNTGTAWITDPGVVTIPATVTLVHVGSGVYTITINPNGNLYPYVRYVARFAATIADNEGSEISSAQVSWEFTALGPAPSPAYFIAGEDWQATVWNGWRGWQVGSF